MKPITVADPQSRSADLLADNFARLRELFPEAITAGQIDFDVLKQLLGGEIDEREEKYGLNWHGKRLARRLALTPSTSTLRPVPDAGVNWEKTRNLMIEGENLEVLKLLQKSYSGEVKLIYIDPPYNTGNDFVYPDDFRDSIGNYLKLTGQVEGGAKVTSNPETSGRFHTDWLNMMYPRLKLSRDLLKEDGIVVVSLDDNEVYHLRLLMNEVFGPENFVATVVWQKVYSPKNSAKHFSEDHDYLVVYARNAATWRPRLLPRSEEANARYENTDDDSRGEWKPGDMTARNYYADGQYEVRSPAGNTFKPPRGRYWVVNRDKFQELDADKRIWWGEKGENMPALKRFLTEVKQGIVPQTMWFYDDVGHTQEAKKELLEFVPYENTDNVLDTVKPTRLLRRILQIATSPSGHDLVLDYFSGSASMAHAVLDQNREDSGNRRFMMVQSADPLPVPETKLKRMTDIGQTRVRNVIGKLSNSTGTLDRTEPEDLGFRVFKLDTSNIRAWTPNASDIAKSLFDAIDHLEADRSEADILTELLLKLGLDLCVPIEPKTIVGSSVHSIGSGVLFVCLVPKITAKQVEPLALGIVAWHKEQAPAGESQLVFRDSAFDNDVAKTNMTAILAQHGLTNVRSL